MITGLLLIGCGVGAGIFGSLLGLGGGILIVPILTLGFGLPLREAAAVSLVAVIVTSSAAASVYLERHTANLRLGMSLELFTATGALIGGFIAFTLSDRVLAGLFAILLSYTAFTMARRRDPRPAPVAASPIAATTAGPGATADAGVVVPRVGGDPATSGKSTTAASAFAPSTTAEPATLASASPVPASGSGATSPLAMAALARHGWTGGLVAALSAPDTLARLSGPGYHVRNLGRGMIGAFFAGIVSAVLGVGGGIVKVPVMHLVMGVPLRIATATSNLMIGVTATASAIIYVMRGSMDPLVVGPIAVGAFLGASVGSRIAPRVDLRMLRILFVVVMVYTALQMALRAAAV